MRSRSEIREWTIYKIVTPDGMIYIGKTDNIKRRKSHHATLHRQSNKYLKKSIEKFGWDSHDVAMLDIFKSDDVYAQGKEMFWIRTYMSNRNRWPEMNGLNLTDGGLGILGYRQSDEHKAKISKANTGRKVSDEQKGRISKTLSGRKLPVNRVVNAAKAHEKPMIIYDLSGNFIKECESGRAVYKFLYGKEGSSGHIHEVAMGKRENYKGYIFKYK